MKKSLLIVAVLAIFVSGCADNQWTFKVTRKFYTSAFRNDKQGTGWGYNVMGAMTWRHSHVGYYHHGYYGHTYYPYSYYDVEAQLFFWAFIAPAFFLAPIVVDILFFPVAVIHDLVSKPEPGSTVKKNPGKRTEELRVKSSSSRAKGTRPKAEEFKPRPPRPSAKMRKSGPKIRKSTSQ